MMADVFRFLPILIANFYLIDAKSEDTYPFMYNMQNFLSKSGFPRPACKCNQEPGSMSSAIKGEIGDIVGFYNVFKGADEKLFDAIIDEQVRILETSGLAAASEAINVVYFGSQYDTFRVPSNSSKFIVSPKSAPSGDERVTLQLLHDHCAANRGDRVFYIHSKGSFHPNVANDQLRRNHMKAVVACWQLDGVAQNDVCGFRVSPLPHPHIPGNMWFSRCDYISKLPSPSAFEGKMAKAAAVRLAANKCPHSYVGASRYAQEHWVLSHPSVIASDVLPMGPRVAIYAWNYDDIPDPPSWAPDLETFPRAIMPFIPFLGRNMRFANKLGCAHETQRLREYHDLFGAGVMAGLPCASMYCQWYPFAFLQLHTANVPGWHHAIRRFVEDMIAVGAGNITMA